MRERLTDEEFAELVEQALASLPKQFAPYMENVMVEVLPRPDRRMLADLKIRGGMRLLGLYHGVPLPDKSVWRPYEMPELIYIFKDNVESVCERRQEIVEQVRKTVLHEVGHHFGMTEEDMDELGYG